MVSLKVLTLTLFFLFKVEAKVFERCDLARTLKNDFPSNQVPTWMCIIDHESHYDTNAYNPTTGDHGLFQISEKFWCSTSNVPGKGCNTVCSKFHDDDIRDDVGCVKKIFEEHQRISGNGFNAWTTYSSCKGDNSRYIDGCF